MLSGELIFKRGLTAKARQSDHRRSTLGGARHRKRILEKRSSGTHDHVGIRPLHGALAPPAPGRPRVELRAPDRGCVSARGGQAPKKSRMTRRVALVSRARAVACPRPADSLARTRNVSSRSTHLVVPLSSSPRRYPRAPEQRGDRSGEGEAVSRRCSLGWHPLRHRDADVPAQQSRRRQQHSEVHRHPSQGLLHKRDQRPQVRPPSRARLENLGTPALFRARSGHPLPAPPIHPHQPSPSRISTRSSSCSAWTSSAPTRTSSVNPCLPSPPANEEMAYAARSPPRPPAGRWRPSLRRGGQLRRRWRVRWRRRRLRRRLRRWRRRWRVRRWRRWRRWLRRWRRLRRAAAVERRRVRGQQQSNGGGYGGGAPPPSYGRGGAVSRNEAPARISPISSLNPYQNRWTIRARVTNTPTLRSYLLARRREGDERRPPRRGGWRDQGCVLRGRRRAFPRGVPAWSRVRRLQGDALGGAQPPVLQP